MGGRPDEPTRKRRREEVSERVALLQHTGDQSTGFFWAVFKCRGRCITIQPSHSYTKKGTAGQKLRVGVAEAGAELEDDEEDVIHNEGPLAAPAVGCDACGV